ncbi:hypothetical protein [Pedobacter heparinus]|uniref:hypothetical protein n=1 Tax=Pedobacter heparinus TaxID=984 RepID=UPI00292CA710|nr:hypothetical protein [Pedobacter heparinus]
MKTLDIKYWGINLINLINEVKKEHRLFGLLMIAWGMITAFLNSPGMTSGINQSVPLMVVLSLITFLLLLELSWWLFTRFWLRVGLPGMEHMVVQFEDLDAWQKLGFLWASFALVLLVGLGCLMVVV